MAMIAPTVDSVGDAALTDSIIDKSITELQDDIVTALKAPALYGCTALKKVAFGSVRRWRWRTSIRPLPSNPARLRAAQLWRL